MKNLRNKVLLIGNLGTDPVIRETSNGNKMARFPMATSEVVKNKEGGYDKRTEWHNIVVFGQLANIVESYLNKGKEIAVEGKLSTRSYDDKNGVKRYTTEVIVSDLVMLSNRSAA